MYPAPHHSGDPLLQPAGRFKLDHCDHSHASIYFTMGGPFFFLYRESLNLATLDDGPSLYPGFASDKSDVLGSPLVWECAAEVQKLSLLLCVSFTPSFFFLSFFFKKKTMRHLTNSPSAIAPIVFKTVEFLTRYGQGRTFLIFSRQ